jgi:hypothetical protein
VTTTPPAWPTPGDDLRPELEPLLAERLGRPVTVAEIAVRPCAYRTSFKLEEIDVRLEGGEQLKLMLKDLGRTALAPGALAAKPGFLADPMREIEVYRDLLAPERLGTPMFIGALVDAAADRFRLVIERVEGDVLWQVGDFETWKEVARWLARMHERFEGRVGEPYEHLLDRDESFLGIWIERARAFARDGAHASLGPDAQERIEWLAARWEQVVERVAALPRTIIHGEFYASNILVAPLRVSPIDWELAGRGAALLDLAALTSGNWSEGERAEMARAYQGALTAPTTGGDADLLDALDHCRLQLAVQWLGWDPAWSPPEEHRQDWLGEAVAIAEHLGL